MLNRIFQVIWKGALAIQIGFIILFVPNVMANNAVQISLVFNDKLQAYNDVIYGFKTTLEKNKIPVNYIENTDYRPINTNTQLILALGSKAINLIPKNRKRFTQTPDIISTLTLNNELLVNTPNLVGISIQASAQKQLTWHQRILPNKKRIGILYNPETSQALIDEFKQSANKLGLEIIAVPVHSPTELTSALKLLAREADTILGIPDKMVYSGKTAKAILLFSYRNRMPFIGLSKSWVKAGAIYALDWNYVSLGKQCAELAMSIIAGEKANSMPLQFPMKEDYLLNLKTANQLKIDLSDTIVAEAREVFQ